MSQRKLVEVDLFPQVKLEPKKERRRSGKSSNKFQLNENEHKWETSRIKDERPFQFSVTQPAKIMYEKRSQSMTETMVKVETFQYESVDQKTTQYSYTSKQRHRTTSEQEVKPSTSDKNKPPQTGISARKTIMVEPEPLPLKCKMRRESVPPSKKDKEISRQTRYKRDNEPGWGGPRSNGHRHPHQARREMEFMAYQLGVSQEELDDDDPYASYRY